MEIETIEHIDAYRYVIMFSLHGKVSIVTGSTSGIGRASALALAAQGSKVVVSGRREAEGQKVVEEIHANGGDAIFVAADVSRPADVDALFAAAKGRFGKIDIVFLNSGVFRFSSLAEQGTEDLGNQIDVNVKGVYYGLQASARELGEGGAVVVNSSVVADVGIPGATAYSLTKGAVNTLVRGAAIELAPRKIRVNAVAPGPVMTEGAVTLFGSPAGIEERFAAEVPLGHVGRPEEIAAAVVFLASDEASFITGQVLRADGGLGVK